MTRKKQRQMERLISLLKKSKEIADQMELVNSGGGDVGGLIGGIADEVECTFTSQMEGICGYCLWEYTVCNCSSGIAARAPKVTQ